MTEIYKKQWNRQYQLKLDLGEGANCHEAYEEYLDYYKLEDTNERWVSFCSAFEKRRRIGIRAFVWYPAWGSALLLSCCERG